MESFAAIVSLMCLQAGERLGIIYRQLAQQVPPNSLHHFPEKDNSKMQDVSSTGKVAIHDLAHNTEENTSGSTSEQGKGYST